MKILNKFFFPEKLFNFILSKLKIIPRTIYYAIESFDSKQSFIETINNWILKNSIYRKTNNMKRYYRRTLNNVEIKETK